MGVTIKQKSIIEIISDLSKRLDNLETGGKPLVTNEVPAIPSEIPVEFTLPADTYATITVTLFWDDANVLANPNGKIYFSFYIDVDNNANNQWPGGNNIDPALHHISWFYSFAHNYNVDFKETIVQILVENLDSISHDYFFYDAFSLFSGQSGAGGG